MIKMKPLLMEIDLTSIRPYATQFVWSDRWGDASSFACDVTVEDINVQFKILSEGYSGKAWTFAFYMPSDSGVHTTNAASTSVRGRLTYLRILSTCLEAIRDFANIQPVDSIDISGADQTPDKSAQKTRIYAELFKANASMFPDFKVVQRNASKLALVRTQQADSTGVPGNVS
jgi:hypothetical protein